MSLDRREQALTSELKEVLASSLDLSEVRSRAEGLLFQLLRADHLAWCVSRLDGSSGYEWMATDRLAAFLARYHEMAGEDFVRGAVAHLPNVVLRDTEMAPREVLERSLPYLLCRELGMPLEHVMSVRLDMKQGWHGGLNLYRERLLPFSEQDQAVLQGFTPLLCRAFRNCRMFSGVSTRGQLPDALFQQRGLECLVLTPAFTEVMRTVRVTSLLEEWFSRSERDLSGLPRDWVERLAWLARVEDGGGFGSDIWVRPGEDRDLRVTFIRLPEQDSRRLWAVVLQEISHGIPLPEAWLPRLTPREAEITSYVLRNWDNEVIAGHLRIVEDTVKTHVRNIFQKLGVDNRAALIYQAAIIHRRTFS